MNSLCLLRLLRLDQLPEDILVVVFSGLDCKSIPKLCTLSKNINSFCTSNMKQILSNAIKTNLDVSDFTIEQLKLLSVKEESTTRIFECGFIGKNGKLFLVDTLGYVINYEKHFIKVVGNYSNRVFLDEDGEVYISGGMSGRLIESSHLYDNYIPGPRKIKNIKRAKDIAAGYLHVLILLEDGTVVGFGDNSYNQLGFENKEYFDTLDNNRQLDIVNKPTVIERFKNIKSIFAKGHVSCFIDNDGKVIMSTGENTEMLKNIIKVEINTEASGFIFLDSKGLCGIFRDNKFNAYIKDNIIDVTENNGLSLIDRNGNVYIRIIGKESEIVDGKLVPRTELYHLKNIIKSSNFLFVDKYDNLYAEIANLPFKLALLNEWNKPKIL
jgi:hypothetical protein